MDIFEDKLDDIYRDYNVLKNNTFIKQNPAILGNMEVKLKEFDMLVENRKKLSPLRVQQLNQDLDDTKFKLKNVRKRMRL